MSMHASTVHQIISAVPTIPNATNQPAGFEQLSIEAQFQMIEIALGISVAIIFLNFFMVLNSFKNLCVGFHLVLELDQPPLLYYTIKSYGFIACNAFSCHLLTVFSEAYIFAAISPHFLWSKYL